MLMNEGDLVREAAETGFNSEPLEKVIRLMELLEGLRSHPFLKMKLALKGGTALNLFVFEIPRLSVDIDFNYIGSADRNTMIAERPELEKAIQAVCSRLGLQLRRTPTEHAGGKYLPFLTCMNSPRVNWLPYSAVPQAAIFSTSGNCFGSPPSTETNFVWLLSYMEGSAAGIGAP